MKMYHIGLLPGRRCGTFFTEHVLIAYPAFRHLFRVEKCKRKNGGRKMPLRVIYGTLTVL